MAGTPFVAERKLLFHGFMRQRLPCCTLSQLRTQCNSLDKEFGDDLEPIAMRVSPRLVAN
jgi:hypothetical protein